MSGGGKSGGGSNFSSGDAAKLVKLQGEQNRISQFGPSGNLLYGNLDSKGQFVQTPGIAAMTQETPYQSSMRQASQNTSQGLFNQLAPQAFNLQGLSFNGLPDRVSQIDWSKVQGVPGTNQFQGMADQASNAIYERSMNMMRPDIERDQRRMDQRLADQGLPIGSEAYANDQSRFQRDTDMARQNLALGATTAGQNQANTLYQQALQGRQAQIGDQTLSADMANQARLAGFGEQQQLRSNQLSELASLLGGSYNPVPSPNFFGPGQVDVQGPYQMAQQSNLANQQQANSLWGSLASLGGAGLYAAAMPGPLFCWVAREVYGNHDPRWIRFREWMLNKAPRWLARAYRRNGPRWALWLHRHPKAKPIVRWFMNKVI
jgi:hypothetical protein